MIARSVNFFVHRMVELFRNGGVYTINAHKSVTFVDVE